MYPIRKIIILIHFYIFYYNLTNLFNHYYYFLIFSFINVKNAFIIHIILLSNDDFDNYDYCVICLIF